LLVYYLERDTNGQGSYSQNFLRLSLDLCHKNCASSTKKITFQINSSFVF
jgi:hypothetical protein